MADTLAEKGVTLEVLGTCMTNITPDSQHDAKVEYRHLWSYAQQAALIAVSEKNSKDGCYHLIQDPERRAKRIAAHYADLYFKSAVKTNKKLQFYWPALAAFVVKDIVEAYRFAREEVLERKWNSSSAVARNNTGSDIASVVYSGDSPYQHVIRTYAALAKGNIWLFMDIYPWLWFFLEYGVNSDGTLNRKRLAACTAERNWGTFQTASKAAVEELPFGPNWMQRLSARLATDPVFRKAGNYFKEPPTWSGTDGYGQHMAAASSAHHYCRTNTRTEDNSYRTPPSRYWNRFPDAYYVMEAEHTELKRMLADRKSITALIKCRNFTETRPIRSAYEHLIKSYDASKAEKNRFQRQELVAIAEQEQVFVLQPLIYDDKALKVTMDMNHLFSRMTSGWISPQFKVIYSFSPTNDDPGLQTVFDAPTGMINRFAIDLQSLPNQADRMAFVEKIARDFNRLMTIQRPYMDGELQKIRAWVTA